MSTTNPIKLGTQRVTALEQTRGAKCSKKLHIQWVAEDANESIKPVPDDAPTVIRVESAGQTTCILQMYVVSRDSPFNNPSWGGRGCPSKWHILHFFKNGAGTNTLKVGWSFIKPSDGSSQGGATDIDVSGIAAGEKTLIVIMWDGFTWRATNWFS